MSLREKRRTASQLLMAGESERLCRARAGLDCGLLGKDSPPITYSPLTLSLVSLHKDTYIKVMEGTRGEVPQKPANVIEPLRRTRLRASFTAGD